MSEIKRGKKKRIIPTIINAKLIGTNLSTKESIIVTVAITKPNQERVHHTKKHEIFLNKAKKQDIIINPKQSKKNNLRGAKEGEDTLPPNAKSHCSCVISEA